MFGGKMRRSKWRRFLDGFDSIYVAIMYRLDYNDNIDRCAFFEELNWGWRQMYLGGLEEW
jgi:hypothetical protein